MRLGDLWLLYEADKRILDFSQHTLKAYYLQMKELIREIGNLEIEEVTLTLLKDYLAKQSERLRPSSLGHTFGSSSPFSDLRLKSVTSLKIRL